jgi:chromosome segregation ATPase
MKDVEKLLSDERTKTQQLESTLEEARRKKEALEATIQAACSKLGRETRENDLVDAINDLMIEGSQADSKIITLNIDIKTLNSTISSLEYDKERLSRQMRALSERTEKEINELKRVYTEDRRAQDASIESMIASKEEKLQSMRTANDGMKGQIERLTVEAAHLQKLKESCEAELKECQEELSAAKEECESLKNKLSEATRNNLAEHYMQIEDEIRIQLNTARREKDATEKKLAAKNKETDRMMDDFYRQKQELTSRTMELTDKLDEMSNERDILQRQEELLKSTIAAKERETKELEKCVTNLKDQLECAQNEAKKYEEQAEKAQNEAKKYEEQAEKAQNEAKKYEAKAEKAEQQALSLRDAVSKYSKDLELANNDLEDSKRVCDLERIAHANAMSDQQSTYESELEKMLLTLEKCRDNNEVLTFENNSLEESVLSLTSRINNLEKAKSKQTNQIVQLKASMNEALEEALRLGSKIDAEEMRHLEITQTLSLVQEENNDLKQSLTGADSSFNEHIGKITNEKHKLQQKLSIKEKQLFEALNSLTHFELKLAKAEQERDQREQLSKNTHEEIKRLRKVTSSLERENEELTGQILILQQDSKADCLYKDLLDKMKLKDIQREEEFHDMNAKVNSLKSQLAAVTQQKNHLEAVNNEKISALQSSLASIKQQLLKKQRCSDDASSTSSKTSKSHLKQIVVELEESVDAIKKHYENKVRSLQHALDSARKKLEKYERKISDLTTLLEENASVVDVLHKKLKMNNQPHFQIGSPVRSPRSEETVESEVSS